LVSNSIKDDRKPSILSTAVVYSTWLSLEMSFVLAQWFTALPHFCSTDFMRIVLNVRHYTLLPPCACGKRGEGDEKQLKQISFLNPYRVKAIFLPLEVLIWPFAPMLCGVRGGIDKVYGCMRRG
jgi:hypothetical protein